MEDITVNDVFTSLPEEVRDRIAAKIALKQHKCKECKWFDGYKCLEPERNRINEEKGWNYYRNFRKMPCEPACIRFEEKENDMNKETTTEEYIHDCEEAVKTLNEVLDMLEKKLDGTPDVNDPKAPKNRYGIGEILYLPVKIVGVRESENHSTILYNLQTIDGKRLGFKLFECVTDMMRDKNYYMPTIPEHLLIENFKEA